MELLNVSSDVSSMFQVLVPGLRGEAVRVYSEFVEFQVPKQFAEQAETTGEEQHVAQLVAHVGAGEREGARRERTVEKPTFVFYYYYSVIGPLGALPAELSARKWNRDRIIRTRCNATGAAAGVLAQ